MASSYEVCLAVAAISYSAKTHLKQEAIAFCRYKETFNISEDIAFSV
jgi:hypothetical protein